jgi:hypothetical protein
VAVGQSDFPATFTEGAGGTDGNERDIATQGDAESHGTSARSHPHSRRAVRMEQKVTFCFYNYSVSDLPKEMQKAIELVQDLTHTAVEQLEWNKR